MEGEELERNSNGNHNHNNDKADVILVKTIFDTPREKLPELTDIPLDQVRPLSMMSALAEEVKMMAQDMKDTQSKHFANWWRYNYEACKKAGIELEDLVKESLKDFSVSESQKLLSIEWQHHYYQLRRSIGGGQHRMGAITLAQDQIAATQQKDTFSTEDLLDRLHEQ